MFFVRKGFASSLAVPFQKRSSPSDDDQQPTPSRSSSTKTSFRLVRSIGVFLFRLSVGLGSFQVFGISTNLSENELSNTSRPVLAQPSASSAISERKLLEIAFETSPLDKKADYRVKLVTQSVEIKYNAVRRDGLSFSHRATVLSPADDQQIGRIFRTGQPTKFRGVNSFSVVRPQEKKNSVSRVKQVAYSTYTDVKHRSFLLMKHNLEKIKVLDIDLDIESSYFLLPESGVFHE